MRLPRVYPAFLAATLLVSIAACSSRESEEDEMEEGALSGADLSVRGERQVHFPVAGRPDELCIVSKKSAGGAYSEADKKLEGELCDKNFYATSPGTGAAICPKDSSTNPGVDVHELEDKTKEQVEAERCPTDKVAKYKQSVTCSYTGSILGYYHVSRFLGGAANVPVAVIRTMDLEAHKKLVQRGIEVTRRTDGPGFDVHDAWMQFASMHQNPAGFRRAAQIYTSDFKQIYGAMQADVSQDARHPSMRVAGGDAGLNQFLRGAAFGAVSQSQALADRFPQDFGKEAVQGLVLAKDASDMVILDELLSQQDRYGNIHSVAFKVFEENGRLKKVKLKRDDRDNVIDKPEVPGVVIEQLVLRDNDCGVAKENKNAAAGVTAKLTHMSAKTYKHFMWFAAEIKNESSAVATQMKEEALFTPTDMQMITRQAASMSASLKQRCQSGALKLDADLEAHLKGETRNIGRDACNLAEPPTVAEASEAGVVDSHGIELVKR